MWEYMEYELDGKGTSRSGAASLSSTELVAESWAKAKKDNRVVYYDENTFVGLHRESWTKWKLIIYSRKGA